jgi:para-aminobenzoate synthetase component 1
MRPTQAIPKINAMSQARTPFLILVDFEMENIRLHPLESLPDTIQYEINLEGAYPPSDGQSGQVDVVVDPYPFDRFYHQFDQVKDELLYGNSFLLNLTAKHKMATAMSLEDIYSKARAKYKLHYAYADNNFVVFSPETFVRIQDGLISSYPMKGTIDADLPQAREILLSDRKEIAEHNTIVDLIRNDLSINAKEVTVTKFKYLDLIQTDQKNLYQMSSEITGRLPQDYLDRLGDILFSMLPAGSISGAPKKKTVEIIQAAEQVARGYYTGICGVFDGQDFESFVMIRYVEQEGSQKYYRSGGGITFMSEVEKEYQEMLDKIYIPQS